MTLVVLMAGGRGLRLGSLTDNHPKPMIHVGSRPMLDIIVDRLVAQGFRRFAFMLGYRGHLIEEHFRDRDDIEATFYHEDGPQGTAGALSALPEQFEPAIIHNADIITDCNYNDLLASHAGSGARITLAAALYQHQVPYGVLDVAGWEPIQEKPVISWPVNAGIYVLDPCVCDMITGPRDMTDVIDQWPWQVYQIDGDWRDVGTLDSLAQARIAAE